MPCIYYGDEAGLEGFEDPFNRRCFPWGHELTSLQTAYESLSRIKGRYAALKRGHITFENPNDHVIHFIRTLNGQRIHTIVNGGSDPMTLPITGQLLFQSYINMEKRLLHLEPWGVSIILE